MHDMAFADQSGGQPLSCTHLLRVHAVTLWRLHGATDDLDCLAVETSFGYALGLTLDTELVLLLLQPTLECLVACADRLESALVAQGWQVIEERTEERGGHGPL
jgi:hypothetical protein